MKTILAILGAIWLGCSVVVAAMFLWHVATERKAEQWASQFRAELDDDDSIHAWLDGGAS